MKPRWLTGQEKEANRRKAMVYTLFSIVLVSLLMFSIALKIKPVTVQDTINERARVEQLHYYGEDIIHDMIRAADISFKRALVAIITREVSTGEFTTNISQVLPGIMINGTIQGEELPFFQNETLSAWREKISDLMLSARMSFNSSFTNFTVMMDNYTSVSLNFYYTMELRDPLLMANLTRNGEVNTHISMEGVEDPFITVNTLAYILNTFRMCPSLKAMSYSTSDFYGIAYVDTTSADFTYVADKSSKVLVTDTLTGKTNYTGFAGVIVQKNEVPAENVNYVAGVDNATILIKNSSYVVKHDSYIYLTNLTDDECINEGNSSCYFSMNDAPTVLDRIEGRNYHTPTYDPDGSYGIASYICLYNLPPELRKSSNPLVLDYRYLPLW